MVRRGVKIRSGCVSSQLSCRSYPRSAFSDRLLYLEILRQLNDPGYRDYLATLQKDALAKPADLGKPDRMDE